MFAELASIMYWVTTITWVVLILFFVYKLVETVSFKHYIPLIAVTAVCGWLLTSHLGTVADELHETDRSYPIISTMAISFLMWLPIILFFGALFDGSRKQEKEDMKKAIAAAVAEAVADQMGPADAAPHTLSIKPSEPGAYNLAEVFASDPGLALHVMQIATDIELDGEQLELAKSTGREVVDQGEPTLAKLAERWADVIELAQFSGRIRKHMLI